VTVTAIYHRDEDGNWLVRLAEEPRCHTWARSLKAARAAIREAAELWTDELGVASVDDLVITERVEGIEGVGEALELAGMRAALASELTVVRAALDNLAPNLLGQGLSVRDVADLLALSPGRISQIAPGVGSLAATRKAASGFGRLAPPAPGDDRIEAITERMPSHESERVEQPSGRR
jgi:predicted RNase H-like HicB family nuclease